MLVLYAYEKDLPANLLLENSIRATFKEYAKERIDVFSEYMDLGRFGDDRYPQQLLEYYRNKFARHQFDLILPVMALALDFVLNHREQLFPGVPVVYSAIYKRELIIQKISSNVIGIPAEVDMNATLNVALHLHPDTRRVVVVGGATGEGPKWIELAQQNFRADAEDGKIEFLYLSGLPMRELLDRVAHLPKKTIVLYISILRDGEGKTFLPREALERLSRASSAPVYGFFDTYLGHGIVGGRLLSFEAEGKNAAQLGLRILAGEKVQDVSTSAESSNAHLFDGRQLSRWGVSEANLPQGSIVRYREPTAWELYQGRIIGGILLCLVQTLLIAGLLVQRARQKRLERSLDDRLQFEMLVTELSRALVHATAKAIDQAIHQGLERIVAFLGADRGSLFQFSEEMNGFTITHSYRVGASPPAPSVIGLDQFPWIFTQVLGAKAVRLPRLEDLPAEATVDRRNCERFGALSLLMVPLSVGGGTLGALSFASIRTRRTWADDLVVRLRLLGEVFTITLLRQRSEEALRRSEQQLRILAGQLLQAQEMERRRLAREMHDDLTQRLAVLAIQAAKLEQRLALTGPDSESLTDMRDELVRLSEDVHNLSRQLHPSILDDLGLIDALRSECASFHQREGIAVDFQAEDVPTDLSKDVALCLYRITQESLRNIAKHAKTRQARVTMVGQGNEVLLTVGDTGKGFDPEAPRPEPGLGLASMGERARLIGAELSIQSRPGKGTTISMLVVLPGSQP